MGELISYQNVKDRILEIRGERVLLDRDLANLYGVETREINQAVRNNPDKFPNGYIIVITSDEWNNLKSNILISSWGGSRKIPTAFSEKGLYMLATILKSPTATQTTIAIVETFAKLRELTDVIDQLPDTEDEDIQQSLMIRGSEIVSEIMDESIMAVVGNKTSFELNLGALKVKHTVKREKRKADM